MKVQSLDDERECPIREFTSCTEGVLLVAMTTETRRGIIVVWMIITEKAIRE